VRACDSILPLRYLASRMNCAWFRCGGHAGQGHAPRGTPDSYAALARYHRAILKKEPRKRWPNCGSGSSGRCRRISWPTPKARRPAPDPLHSPSVPPSPPQTISPARPETWPGPGRRGPAGRGCGCG
jgi:hypothetical protein